MSISLSKWPMLPRIAWCFILAICSTVTTSLLPVDGDDDVGDVEDVVERGDLVAVHRRLQRADRVDLGDDHAGTLAAQRLRAALADVAVAADDRDLAADEDVGGAVDAVDQRVAAAVLVVELRLGDRVVDVDGGEEQRALLHHVVEPVHAGGGLLGDALDLVGDLGPAVLALGERGVEDLEDDLLLVALGGGRVGRLAGLLGLARRGGRAAWRRRRRRGSCWRTAAAGPAAGSAGCTTSTPPASRPSRRRPGRPAGRSAVPFGPTATAAAAWSWVEKMLQDAQRTSAPSATSVSISTAVWIVMCSEPAMRAPASGLLSP